MGGGKLAGWQNPWHLALLVLGVGLICSMFYQQTFVASATGTLAQRLMRRSTNAEADADGGTHNVALGTQFGKMVWNLTLLIVMPFSSSSPAASSTIWRMRILVARRRDSASRCRDVGHPFKRGQRGGDGGSSSGGGGDKGHSTTGTCGGDGDDSNSNSVAMASTTGSTPVTPISSTVAMPPLYHGAQG